jgi:hypothetical protein
MEPELKPIKIIRSCAMGNRPAVLLVDELDCPCVQAANAGTVETTEKIGEIQKEEETSYEAHYAEDYCGVSVRCDGGLGRIAWLFRPGKET